jgi:hypothetical protein
MSTDPSKGDRVSYQVMYSDGQGFGEAHIVRRAEFGRITKTWPPEAPAMARIAVENPQPGRAKYVTRKLRDIEAAPDALTAAIEATPSGHLFSGTELLNITRLGLSRIYTGPAAEVSEAMRECARQALAELEGRASLDSGQARDTSTFQGFTTDQLKAAFGLVKNPENWKLPIDAVVPGDANLNAIGAACLFYCGSPADMWAVEGGHRVTAAGYYACIGS